MQVTPRSQIEPGFSLLRSVCFLHSLLLFSRLKCISDTNWHITRRTLTSRGAKSQDTDGDCVPGQEANSKGLEVALGCKKDKSIETRNSAGTAQAGIPGQCFSHISCLCGREYWQKCCGRTGLLWLPVWERIVVERSWKQESKEFGHLAFAIRKQRVMRANVKLAFSILFSSWP